MLIVQRSLMPCAALMLILSVAPVFPAHIDGIAASVNGKVITLLELQKAGRPLLEKRLLSAPSKDRRRIRREALRSVLDEMILKELQVQRAQELGIKVPEREVEAFIADVKDANNFDEKMLRQALREEDLEWDKYRQEVAEQILLSKLVHQEIRTRITVSKEEIESYYLDHEDDYFQPERIRVRHLLVRVGEDADQEEESAALLKALALIDELQQGADFAELLMKYSPESVVGEDAVSNFFTRGEFIRELEEVAFSLTEGEVSEPVRTEAGFYLVQVVERHDASQQPLEEVQESIRQKLLQEKTQAQYQEWHRRLRESAQVDIRF